MRDRDRNRGKGEPRRDTDAERAGDSAPRSRVSVGGNTPADAPGELPGDRKGGGTAERNRDRSAGLGEGLPHEGADVPDEGMVGGQTSAAQAGREILDAIEEREPRRAGPR